MYARMCQRVYIIHYKRRLVGFIPAPILRSHSLQPTASEKCHQEKRKTVNGEDILFAMTSLGFENYAEALKIYLTKYREVNILPFSYPVAGVALYPSLVCKIRRFTNSR
jgi:hypothetical protein